MGARQAAGRWVGGLSSASSGKKALTALGTAVAHGREKRGGERQREAARGSEEIGRFACVH